MDSRIGMRQIRRLKVIAEDRKKPWSWSNLLKAAKKRRNGFSMFSFHKECPAAVHVPVFIIYSAASGSPRGVVPRNRPCADGSS
jgi:hypothetical protein